jgi:hypothetical protein
MHALEATVLGDLRADELFAVRLKLAERTFLIETHQPAVTGNITCPYRSQSPISTIFCHTDGLRGLIKV